MKRIAILGSTGSIGTQSLDVIRNNRELFAVEALTCGENIELIKEQIREFCPRLVVVKNESDASQLAKMFPKVEFSSGDTGLIEAATSDCHLVLNSLMGMMGLSPTYHAIEAGKDIALANKETLVAGGKIVMDAVKAKGVRLLPVDSEHSAIFQCLEGNRGREIRRILLTCSGGPFRNYTKEQLEKVTRQDALRHPKWNMGNKITVDSATLMNKGLEVIEAKWLFDVEPEKIDILIHPQSIVHSAVEYMDKSVIAQLGLPDMRIPISLALSYPKRLESREESLDFFGRGSNLTFEQPNRQVFTTLNLAYEAIGAGESYPAALNGANEVLVDYFLKERIRFIDIQSTLERFMENHRSQHIESLEDVLETDRRAREETEELIKNMV